jgi:site-specific DNA-cytosine methylase
MYHVGLFEGIGGFSLAARWSGLESEISCEIDEDCRDVLKSNFPNTFLFDDVKKLTKKNF